MTMSLREQRESIQEVVDQYFGAHIDVTPRALSALQGSFRSNDESIDGNKPRIIIDAESILEGLMLSSPACLSVLYEAGIPIESIFHKEIYEDETAMPGVLAPDSLDDIFCGSTGLAEPRPAPCPAYRAVKRSKRLTEDDLLMGFLETVYLGPIRFGTDPFINDRLNVLGHILLGCGFVQENQIIEKYDPVRIKYSAVSVAAKRLKELKKFVARIPIADPSHDLYQFALWQEPGGAIRFRPFGVGVLSRSPDSIVAEGKSYICREGIFQPLTHAGAFSIDAIAELEDLINSSNAAEFHFQRFFTEHPEFLTGLDYSRAHPQLVLYNEIGRNRIPDFMLEPMSSEFCDLLELKLPYEAMVRRVRSRGHARFYDFIDDAITQLIGYRRYFEDAANRKDFHRRYGLSAYHPTMILVCGRRHHFKSDLERSELRQLLPEDLRLWTYDDLLDRARRFHACYR